MQFVRPGVVLMQMAPDRANPNWDGLRDNRARLEGETDATGRKLEVVEMPVLPYVEVAGERFVVPYVNYFPVNGGIVAPLLAQPDDEVGLRAAARAVPGPRGRRRAQHGCSPTAAAGSAASPSNCRQAMAMRRSS